MKKIIFGLIGFCLVVGFWFLLSEVYTAEAQKGVESVSFDVRSGETVSELAQRLADEQIIRHAWLFQKYLVLKGIDKKINYGEFIVEAPITLAHVAKVLSQPGLNERVITVIPGWTITELANYFAEQGMFTPEEVTSFIGRPARDYKVVSERAPEIDLNLKILADKPWYVSYEGYLAPDTYRVYKNANVAEVVKRLLEERDKQITVEMWQDIDNSGRTFFEVLTMASLLEKEVQNLADKKKVADIFWRRYDLGWALQADSTVHYALGKTGEVFTTKEERETLSPWNTYRYPGLPRGPICNPSLVSIEAALYPEKNDYWYFLTTPEGAVKYAKNLDEHNRNRARFLN